MKDCIKNEDRVISRWFFGHTKRTLDVFMLTTLEYSVDSESQQTWVEEYKTRKIDWWDMRQHFRKAFECCVGVLSWFDTKNLLTSNIRFVVISVKNRLWRAVLLNASPWESFYEVHSLMRSIPVLTNECWNFKLRGSIESVSMEFNFQV